MIYYVGDTHGRVDAVKKVDAAAIANGVNTVVQVGDFGCHFSPGLRCNVDEYFQGRESGPVWYTCGGNHDNWATWNDMAKEQGNPDLIRLTKDCFFVRQGATVLLEGKSHLFFGGAESTDKHMRWEGHDWWPEETPSRDEFYTFFDALNERRPDVVVTHDAPIRVVIKRLLRNENATPNGLENALKHSDYQPPVWVFGHHHRVEDWTVGETRFYCCGVHGQFVSL